MAATKKTKTNDRTAELHAASLDYRAAYAAFNAAVRMNVATPEGCGSFGGVWDCDPARLLRALVLAIRRTQPAVSAAVEKAARGEAVTVGECGYGDAMPTGCDVYETPNGSFRDSDGRYLTGAEIGIIVRSIGRNRHRFGPQNWDDYHAHRFAPSQLVQGWIESEAGGMAGRSLTASYDKPFPANTTDQMKLDAYRRVAAAYRTLAECFAEAA